MSPNRTARFFRRRWTEHPLNTLFWSLFVVIGLPCAVALALYGSQQKELTHTQDRLVDFQVDNEVKRCEAANGGRKALQSVLDDAARPEDVGAQGVDFAAIDGFDALDADTQFFLENLEDAVSQPGGSDRLRQIADNYRENYPSNLDCEASGRALRRKLEGHDAN